MSLFCVIVAKRLWPGLSEEQIKGYDDRTEIWDSLGVGPESGKRKKDTSISSGVVSGHQLSLQQGGGC